MKTRVTYPAAIEVVVDHETGAVEAVRLRPPEATDGDGEWVLATQLLNGDGSVASRADWEARYPGERHAPDPFPLLEGDLRLEVVVRLGRTGWLPA